MASIKLIPQSAHKALPFSANLANLLPTGTVFAFQAIIPSFSNNGRCEVAHKYMTLGLIIACSISCFLSSFTDSFVGNDGKLYYGIATFKGLWVFNDEVDDGLDLENDKKETDKIFNKYKLTAIDFLHACCSLTLFLVIACSSFEVQRCFFPKPGPNGNALMTNLPLGFGILASGLFILFPTKRRGIGYGDHGDGKEEKQIEEIGHKGSLPCPK
ncbi:putative disease resistance protein NBS-LRR family protein [Hibiscus syriacus]|uniref:Disease resistance protein NBS-LRR family protein n=1 Tax=Hibiscus syriacus TaxID=106335 RepID=A0A6A2Z5Q8_HIBSY|nr:protein DMP10-like [Hibiscus syriacus]KAE8687304.1 putative disease resistance protein NBS-LRR family protein [Hibiscus syriacus]